MAFLVVLESLSPVERAAYLLRRVFDYGYGEIAGSSASPRRPAGSSSAGPRSVSSGAGRGSRPTPTRPSGSPRRSSQACSSGDMDGLLDILAPDAVLYSDGGGKATAALAPIRGADRVARFFLGIMKKAPAGLELRRVRVNGQPGLLAMVDGQVIQVLTFDVVDGRIAACFVVRNPDKLARVEPTAIDRRARPHTSHGAIAWGPAALRPWPRPWPWPFGLLGGPGGTALGLGGLGLGGGRGRGTAP